MWYYLNVGVEFGARMISIDGKQIKLQIWDTVSWLLIGICITCTRVCIKDASDYCALKGYELRWMGEASKSQPSSRREGGK